LFSGRSGECTCASGDWLRAEREVMSLPEAKLSEKDGKLHIELAVPGFDAKDLKITTAENELVVQAENCRKEEQEDGNIYFCEFSDKSFFRRFALPAPVNVDRVTAHLEKGILHVTAPKLEQNKIHIAAA
jgi:HSP20 family protein